MTPESCPTLPAGLYFVVDHHFSNEKLCNSAVSQSWQGTVYVLQAVDSFVSIFICYRGC